MKKRRLSAVFVLAAAVMALGFFSGCAEKRVEGGELCVGIASEVTGEFGYGQWETTGADRVVRALVDGGSPVCRSETGEYSVDTRYAESLKSEYLADGSKVFTVELRDDICWSDGEKITAENYVAAILLFSGNAAKAAGASGVPGCYYAGAEEYAESGVFSGVRLEDKYVFSVTVAAEHLPYYWELSYIDVLPLDTELWIPEGTVISSDTGGSSFSPAITDEVFAKSIVNARFAAGPRRSVGPYSYGGVSDNMAVLELNPNYRAVSEDETPVIERLLFVETDGTAAAVENGIADIVIGVENAYAAAESLSQTGKFGFSAYGADTLTELLFQCDFGPTQFAEVRRAAAWLCDRQTMAERLAGKGASVPEDMFTPALSTAAGASSESFARNQDRARETLVENGWVLNAAGQAYTSGVRYKLVTREDAEGCIDTVVLADGRILMPLRLRVACNENSGHSLFVSDLAHAASSVGMEVVSASIGAKELSDRLERNSMDGIGYAVPLYNAFIVETGVEKKGDLAYRWTDDWRLISEACNPSYFYDEELDRISMQLSFGAEKPEEFYALLNEYSGRWAAAVPELPICRAAVCDVYSNVLRGYSASDTRDFARAVLSAWVNPEMA